MTAPGRLSAPALERLLDLLSERDREILGSLKKVRVLTGGQLERLHFADLSPASLSRTRRRVLARLVALGLVATLERRVGGVRAGSAGLVYALNASGQRAVSLLAPETADGVRARRPWTPGELFLRHGLDVSEMFVLLRERERAGELELAGFSTEPDCWHSNGMGGVIKPDGYVVLRAIGREVEDCWWVEVDRATVSLTTLRSKLLAYVDFAITGQLGPDGVTPRVLVTVPHERRLEQVREVVAALPEPAGQLIWVEGFEGAVGRLIQILLE